MLGVFPHCLTVYIRSASGREHDCDGLMLNPLLFFIYFLLCLSERFVTDDVGGVLCLLYGGVRARHLQEEIVASLYS